MPHSISGPRLAVKPSAATSREHGDRVDRRPCTSMSTSVTSGSPRTALICASVSMLHRRRLAAVRPSAGARGTPRAGARSSPTWRSARASAPSRAPSRRRRPRRRPRRRTPSGRARSAPARGRGSRRRPAAAAGVNVPMPPVITIGAALDAQPGRGRHGERSPRRVRARPPGARAGTSGRAARPARPAGRPGRGP